MVRNVTNDATPDVLPSLAEGWVAWERGEPLMDLDIWAYNIAQDELVQVTNNFPQADIWPNVSSFGITFNNLNSTGAGPFSRPLFFGLWTRTTTDLTAGLANEGGIISQGSLAAWVGFDSVDKKILLRNLATGFTTQITANAVDDMYPLVCPRYLLWVRFNEDLTQSLIAYDLPDGPERVVATAARPINSFRAGYDGVAFVVQGDMAAIPDGVWLWQGEPGPAVQIGGGPGYSAGPVVIGDGSVVWQQGTTTKSDLILYDIATSTTRILHKRLFDMNPQLSDGTVAFVSTDQAEPRSGTLYHYDIRFRHFLRLAENVGTKGTPALSGKQVAWVRLDEATETTDLSCAFVPDLMDIGPRYPPTDAIRTLQRLGLVSGYQENSSWWYRPDDPLFRAQFAKMVVNLMELPVDESMTSPFTDLDPDDPGGLYPTSTWPPPPWPRPSTTACSWASPTSAPPGDPWATLDRGNTAELLVNVLTLIAPTR